MTRTLFRISFIYNDHIVGEADIHYHGASIKDRSVAIEITPYANTMQEAGLVPLAAEEWDTFSEIPADGDIDAEKFIDAMLQTIIHNFSEHSPVFKLFKRKIVEDLYVIKEDHHLQLVMITEFAPIQLSLSASSDDKCFVLDLENYDLWQFDVGETDEDICTRILPALQLPLKHRLQKY